MDLHYLEVTELADLLRRRQITSVEVTRALLDRIDSLDGRLTSYVRTLHSDALRAAEAADADIASGRYRGLLHGVPLGVKDLFWVKDVPAAAGTMIHRDFVPDEDATAVARLKEAGAIVLGKLQLTEGAYSDHHPAVTPPKNPWNEAYWPGISSSGSAVATAAGLCFGSLASDTGGSIRWPCSATGLTGIKPAWGRVSRFGVFELAASLDHVGPIARSAADVAAILAAIAGPDDNDPTTIAEQFPVGPASTEAGIRGLRLGIDARWNSADVDPSVQHVLDEAQYVFGALGADVIQVVAPDVTQAVIDWAPACALEAAVAHRSTYPSRKDEYGPVLASVLDAGHAIAAVDYQAIRVRRMQLRGRFAHQFRSIDMLLMPVQPFGPLTLAEINALGTRPDLILKLQRYTAPFDLTGHPTVVLPGGFSEQGLPIGFQLAGRCETTLLRAAIAFQRQTAWHKRHPIP
jgi:amidase